MVGLKGPASARLTPHILYLYVCSPARLAKHMCIVELGKTVGGELGTFIQG